MIIRNIGGKTPETRKAHSAKFCGICQEAMQKERGDNLKLEHCAECISTDKISQAAYWKNTLALKQANSLSPDMAMLAKKLADKRVLIEGSGFKRLAGMAIPSNNIRDVKAAQNNETSLDTVRSQVAELLPSVLNEYGLLGKVDAELILDAIVPNKIASPIADPMGGRSALRNIIAETVAFLDNTKVASKEALIRPHGISAKASDVTSILNEGFRRISSESGEGTRSRTIKAATSVNPFDEQEGFAPDENDDPNDDGSKVVHLPDEQAQEIIHDKANPPLPQGAMDMMNPEMGQDPNMDEDPSQVGAPGQDDMMNEGVGTYSGGENLVPSSDDMEEMPDEGIKRVQSSTADFVARRLSDVKTAKPQVPSDLRHFSFAGKINELPAQIVKLAAKQKTVIEHYQPLAYYTASYNDGAKKTFKCYATDKGAVYLNNDFSIHATSEQKFMDFIESDPSFKRWAFLPPVVDVKEIIKSPDSVEDMALSGNDPMDEDSEGTPSFNEIRETHLNSSPDNAMGGLADDQKAIYDNGDPGTDGPELADGGAVHNPEEELLDTATGLMPEIEKMFPHDSPENQMDMAIEAALNILENRSKVG